MGSMWCRWISVNAACWAIFIQSGMTDRQTTTLMERVTLQADDISRVHGDPLLSTRNETRVQVVEGSNITWMAVIDALRPAHSFVWHDKEGQPIFNCSRFRIGWRVAQQQTISCLTVMRAKRSDEGVYRIVVSDNGRVQSLNFTLGLLYKPSVRISETSSTFQPDRPFVFHWQVESNPPAEIYLAFEGTSICRTGVQGSFNQSITSGQPLKSGSNQENVRLQRNASQSDVELSGSARQSGEYLVRACNSIGCSADVNGHHTIRIASSADHFHLYASMAIVDKHTAINVTCRTAIDGLMKRITWFRIGSNQVAVSFNHKNHPTGMRVITNKNDGYLEETLQLKLTADISGNYTCQVSTFVQCPENIDEVSSEEYDDESEEVAVDSSNRTLSITTTTRDFYYQSGPIRKTSNSTNPTDLQVTLLGEVSEELAAFCQRQHDYPKLAKIADSQFLISTCNHTSWLVVTDKSLAASVLITDVALISSSQRDEKLIGGELICRLNQLPTWTVQCKDDPTMFYIIAVNNTSICCAPRTDPTRRWVNTISNGTALQQFVLDVTMTIKQQTVALSALAVILAALVVIQVWKSSQVSWRIFCLRRSRRWKPANSATCNTDGAIDGKIKTLQLCDI